MGLDWFLGKLQRSVSGSVTLIDDEAILGM